MARARAARLFRGRGRDADELPEADGEALFLHLGVPWFQVPGLTGAAGLVSVTGSLRRGPLASARAPPARDVSSPSRCLQPTSLTPECIQLKTFLSGPCSNVLSNSHNFPTPLEARTFLGLIPQLERVTLRNRLPVVGSFGWERQDDDQDDLLAAGLGAGAEVGGSGDVPVMIDEGWVEDRKDELVERVEAEGWAKVGRGLRVVGRDSLVVEER